MTNDPNVPWAADVLPYDYEQATCGGENAKNVCSLVVGQLWQEYPAMSAKDVWSICDGIFTAVENQVKASIDNLNKAGFDGDDIFNGDASCQVFSKELYDKMKKWQGYGDSILKAMNADTLAAIETVKL